MKQNVPERKAENRITRQRAAERKIVKALIPVIILLTALAAIMIWQLFIKPEQQQPFPGSDTAYVYFIDVGQGDCALIRSGDTDILIDSGEYDRYPDVCRTLDSLGVKELDYAVISHPHSDHMGCMYRIIEEHGAGTVIMPEIPAEMLPVNVPYSELTDIIAERNIPVLYAKAGMSVDLGAAGALDIIAPVKEYEDLNNFSAVIRYRFGDTGFLFCGDIEKEAEEDILSAGCDISADVIKVPHHGSGTSSTRAFVRAVSPGYAVFSAGQENDFGHPHANIVRLYESLGAEILRTDLNGTITFVTDGHNIDINTEKRRPMNMNSSVSVCQKRCFLLRSLGAASRCRQSRARSPCPVWKDSA